MRAANLITVAAGLVLAPPGHAQSRPDFSGEWARVDSLAEQRSVAAVGDAAFRVGTMGSGWGSPLTIRQQANLIVVEYPYFATYDLQPKLRFTFALDGSESTNAVMIGHAESVLRSRVAWRDSTLIITTVYPGPAGSAAEVRQALTLESPASLIVETTRPGAVGTTPVVTRTVYSKR